MIMPLIGFVLIPIFIGLLMYLKPNKLTKMITIVIQSIMLFYSLYYIVVLQSVPEILEYLSASKLPVGMTLKLDTLSSITILLNNLLFLLMIVFNNHKKYMNKLFIFLFLSLQGVMNGIFLSNDFFNVYVLIEVATVTISILIMFKKDSQSMYDGMIYLMVNMTGMAFFLLGVGYIYKYFGVLDFDTISYLMEGVKDPKPLIMPYALLLTGISLKAALMPLFSWLPKAHGTPSAPSIVSGILSGVFIKIGVYLFIRVLIMFNPIIEVSPYFLVMGFITSIAGFVFAIAQKDIKLILAYHTISQVGLILIGLSLGDTTSYYGALYHILTHGIFKSLLFLMAGICTEMYHTREISKMKGLWYHSKLSSITLIIAILSITGAPFMSGGYSKYLINYSSESIILVILLKIIGLGTMVSFIKFFKMIFSKPKEENFKPLEINQKLVIIIMAMLCIILGVFGDYIVSVVLGFKSYFPIAKQVSKMGSYLIAYALGYGVYKLIIENRKWTTHVSGIDLSFNNICISIVSFFVLSLFVFQYCI